jgi:8-oxo-dGTP pyrophosphatase MutT (NUDIX family)
MSAPVWLTRLAARATASVNGDGADDEGLDRRRFHLPPTGQPGHRQSAVLILFGDGPAVTNTAERSGATVATEASNVSILLTERAHSLRSHPGQVSFPGGRLEPSDRDLVATALREAHEEVGVEPDSVDVAGMLPPLNLSVSAHDVSPVLGWWRRPGAAWVRDPGEVARVLQVPVADLVDPANRFRVGHPSGWVGPAFQAEDLVVWGFTAWLLDGVLRLGGWEVPWDESDVRPVP